MGLMVGIGSLGATESYAWAETGYFTLSIANSGKETYESLIREAETTTQAAITQGFAQNANLTEIQMTVLGEHNGQVVPIMTSTVSRSDWRDTSEIRQWTQYFQFSYALLGLGDSQQAGVRDGSNAEPVVTSYHSPSAFEDPIDELMEAAENGRISEAELAELIDAWD